MLFPKGNNQKKSVSVYLEIANPKEHGIADGWHTCAQFALAISNPEDPTSYYSNSKYLYTNNNNNNNNNNNDNNTRLIQLKSFYISCQSSFLF